MSAMSKTWLAMTAAYLFAAFYIAIGAIWAVPVGAAAGCALLAIVSLAYDVGKRNGRVRGGYSRTEGAGLDNAAAEPCSTGERAAEHGIVDPALPAPSVVKRVEGIPPGYVDTDAHVHGKDPA